MSHRDILIICFISFSVSTCFFDDSVVYDTGGEDSTGGDDNSTGSSSVANCTFNGQNIASGDNVTTYQASSVSYGESCVSQVRTCLNGMLDGTYTFATCTAKTVPSGSVWNSSGSGPARQNHSSVVFDNKMWVIGGSTKDYESPPTGVWSSSDGVTWRSVGTGPALQNHSSVVFDNKMWVIGGSTKDYESPPTGVWSSSDGVTWRHVANGPARQNHSSVVFDNKMWVIGGSTKDANTAESTVYSSE